MHIESPASHGMHIKVEKFRESQTQVVVIDEAGNQYRFWKASCMEVGHSRKTRADFNNVLVGYKP